MKTKAKEKEELSNIHLAINCKVTILKRLTQTTPKITYIPDVNENENRNAKQGKTSTINMHFNKQNTRKRPVS